MLKRASLFVLLAGAGIGIAACESSHSAAEPVQMARSQPVDTFRPQNRPVSAAIGRLSTPMNDASSGVLLNKTVLDPGPNEIAGVGPAIVGAAPGELVRVKYSARDAAADEVLRVLVGDYLGRSYMLGPTLSQNKGKAAVTLELDLEMTKRDLTDLVGALAMLHGWAIEDNGEMLVIESAANMARSSKTPILEARAVLGTDEPAVRVFRLTNVAADKIAEAVKELVSEGAQTIVSGRTLLVVDRVRQLNRIGNIIDALDVQAFRGVEIWTYEMNHADVGEAYKILGSLALATGLGDAPGGAVSFVPIPSTNRIMVVSRDPSVHPMVRDLVKQVDAPPSYAATGLYVYRVQHADPASLDKTVKAMFADQIVSANEASSQGAMVVHLDLDSQTFHVRATPSEYAQLYEFLSHNDLPPQQVMLSTQIAEVALTDSMQLGVEYFLSNDTGEGLLELTGSLVGLGPAAPAGSAFFLASDGFAVIRALKAVTDVQTISEPKLYAIDGGEASFQVGGEVPIITSNVSSSVQDQGTTGFRQEIEYRDTGIILEIQPRINETGVVTLNIRLQIRDVVPTSAAGGIDSPEFTLREVTTTVAVPHGMTVMISGFREVQDNERVNKIPLLGGIPLLGPLFQNVSTMEEQRELLVTITPQVVNDPTHADPLLSEFYRRARALELAVLEFELETAQPDAAQDPELRFEDPQPDADEPSPRKPAERAPAVFGLSRPSADLAKLTMALPADTGTGEWSAMAALLKELDGMRGPSDSENSEP